jgi:hypothetical protein
MNVYYTLQKTWMLQEEGSASKGKEWCSEANVQYFNE